MTRRRFSPGRWAVGAAAALLAGAGVGLASHADEPHQFPPPVGWVQVPCEPWPGGPGPCYAPPPGETFTIDAPAGPQRCTTLTGGRHACVYVTTEPSR